MTLQEKEMIKNLDAQKISQVSLESSKAFMLGTARKITEAAN